MSQEYIWNLIAKKLSEEASESDLLELERLLRENPELHYPVQTIMDLWTSDLLFDQQEAHEAFKRHITRMEDLKIDFKQVEDSTNTTGTVVRKIILAGIAGGFGCRDIIFCT